MINDAQHTRLEDFFSGYFHEDWPCEAESPEAVVTKYALTARPDDAHAVGEAILGYESGFANDRELEDKLFTDLGCYYRPSAEGLSARLWLQRVANQLLDISRG
jgi:hypothetical protein